MPNMSLKKNEMPVQDPLIRSKNFLEVSLNKDYFQRNILPHAPRLRKDIRQESS
mgnify:CR=1 FL=1